MGEAYDQQNDKYKEALAKARAQNERGLRASWLGTGLGALTSFIPGAGPVLAPFVKSGVTMLAS